jgi:nucleoside-diphosphate-sugar epimerase
MTLSIYGSSGFVGGNFNRLFPGHSLIYREDREPETTDILYFISTTHNYHVYEDVTLDVETNLKVLCEVLDKCRERGPITFNFISSWFVYGKTDELPVTESSTCNPTGFYSITKKCAEDLLISFCKTYSINYRILRLCNVLGSGDRGVSKKKNAITWMINNLKEGSQVNLYDNGTPIRDVMHVEDVCAAIDLVCREGDLNQIYNIGSGVPTRICDIIELAKKELDSPSEINYIDPPEFHKNVQNKDFWMNVDKLHSLGFEPKHSLEYIIKDLCR